MEDIDLKGTLSTVCFGVLLTRGASLRTPAPLNIVSLSPEPETYNLKRITYNFSKPRLPLFKTDN
jgi:hypothetical protein